MWSNLNHSSTGGLSLQLVLISRDHIRPHLPSKFRLSGSGSFDHSPAAQPLADPTAAASARLLPAPWISTVCPVCTAFAPRNAYSRPPAKQRPGAEEVLSGSRTTLRLLITINSFKQASPFNSTQRSLPVAAAHRAHAAGEKHGPADRVPHRKACDSLALPTCVITPLNSLSKP